MALFGNKSNQEKATPAGSKSPNHFAEGTVIRGEIKSNSDIRIEGQVFGSIHAEAKVVIGSSGRVEGDIICESADISGKIIGKMDVKNLLFLKATAYVEGDIRVARLVVESGARFNGNCSMAGKELKHEQKPATLRKEAV